MSVKEKGLRLTNMLRKVPFVVGARLARDAGAAVYQWIRVALIAGKRRSHKDQLNLLEPGLPAKNDDAACLIHLVE
jgi:hypothetical protein